MPKIIYQIIFVNVIFENDNFNAQSKFILKTGYIINL